MGLFVLGSLKKRLFFLLVLVSFLPLALISTISFSTLLGANVKDIRSRLVGLTETERTKIELQYGNLDFASQHLAYGSLIYSLRQFLETKEYSDYKTLEDTLRLIQYTNPAISTMFYYSDSRHEFYSNMFWVDKSRDPFAKPVLSNSPKVRYFVPENSMTLFMKDQVVLSMAREVSGVAGDRIYLYLESEAISKLGLFPSDSLAFPVSWVLVDPEGLVVYVSSSDGWIQKYFQENAVLKPGTEKISNYELFSAKGRKGWSVVSLVRQSELYEPLRTFMLQALGVLVLALILCLIVAGVLSKGINHPLSLLVQEMQLVSSNQLDGDVHLVGIREFDEVLTSAGQMKSRISDLLDEVRMKERLQRELELQMLQHQINPHFLHNTLNTVQWMAKMEGIESIVLTVQYLTRVLSYNLQPNSRIATVDAELEAVGNYIALQRIRLGNDLNFQTSIDDDCRNLPLPRFLFQPLVENSLFHGLASGAGTILIEVKRQGQERFRIGVYDSGTGMTEQTIQDLLELEDSKRTSHLGIGLRYVVGMLGSIFGSDFTIGLSLEGPLKGILVELPTTLGQGGET